MAQVSRPRKRTVATLKNTILNTALTTHYECGFNPPSSILGLIPNYRNDRGDDSAYILSCAEASLPATSLATAELTNDHSGITERHVYRRQYDKTASFTFYVDRYYRQIQLFETWIGYIVNEQRDQSPNYFYRVYFPLDYQTSIWITKFERDFNKPGTSSYEVYTDDTITESVSRGGNENYDEQSLTYVFLNAYPISIDAMPVTYEAAQVLKCTVNFNFSRYITGATRPNAISYPTTGETTDSSSWVGGEWRNHTTGGNSLIASTNRGASDVLDWEARMKAKGITLSKTGRIDDI